jgi:hypothetical protein
MFRVLQPLQPLGGFNFWRATKEHVPHNVAETQRSNKNAVHAKRKRPTRGGCGTWLCKWIGNNEIRAFVTNESSRTSVSPNRIAWCGAGATIDIGDAAIHRAFKPHKNVAEKLADKVLSREARLPKG